MYNYIFDYALVAKEDESYNQFIKFSSTPEQSTSLLHRTQENPAYTHRGLSEEDLAIIRETTSDVMKEKRKKQSYEISPFRALSEEYEDDRMVVSLKEEYLSSTKTSNLNLPALPPPNRFLTAGSHFWAGFNKYYYITSRNTSTELLQTIRLVKRGNFLRYISSYYVFNREKNITTELKSNLTLITYNMSTGRLYLCGYRQQKETGKRRKYYRYIRNALWLEHSYIVSILFECRQLGRLFIQKILKNMTDTIPDINLLYDEDQLMVYLHNSGTHVMQTNQLSNILFAGLLQQKLGSSIKWLTVPITSLILDYISPLMKEDRKRLYKTTKLLSKKNRLEVMIKILLEPHYQKFMSKLVTSHILDDNIDAVRRFLCAWHKAQSIESIPKRIHHLIANSIHKREQRRLLLLIIHITSLLQDFPTIFYFYYDDAPAVRLYYKQLINSYVTFLDKLTKTYEFDLNEYSTYQNTWTTWKDTFNMAKTLGIRLRPNKLNGKNLYKTHNKLSEIINRDQITLKDYKDTIFEEFKSPSSLYDGYYFTQLRTATDLIHEGTVMHHCVGSYASRCDDGQSIIFSMRKDENGLEKSYVTLEISGKTHELYQMYTMYDINVTNDHILSLIEKWMQDIKKIHENDEETYQRKVILKKEVAWNKQAAKELRLLDNKLKDINMVIGDYNYATTI